MEFHKLDTLFHQATGITQKFELAKKLSDLIDRQNMFIVEK